MPVQAAARPVVPDRRARVGVRRGFLDVAQRDPASKLVVMNACLSV
jgi:hypothetical protein